MCKIMEELREEGRQEGRLEGQLEERTLLVQRMLAAGKYALDEIAVISGMPFEEIKKLQKA